jgi:hypothetical protein
MSHHIKKKKKGNRKLRGRLRSGESKFQVSPDKKVRKTPNSVGESWAWWCTPVIIVMVGSIK